MRDWRFPRLEGHLRVAVTVGTMAGERQVVEARLCGASFRGFELMLVGRDPQAATHLPQAAEIPNHESNRHHWRCGTLTSGRQMLIAEMIISIIALESAYEAYGNADA